MIYPCEVGSLFNSTAIISRRAISSSQLTSPNSSNSRAATTQQQSVTVVTEALLVQPDANPSTSTVTVMVSQRLSILAVKESVPCPLMTLPLETDQLNLGAIFESPPSILARKIVSSSAWGQSVGPSTIITGH